MTESEDSIISGTREGGLRTREKNLAKDPDYYSNLGKKGGKAPHSAPRGFAAVPRSKAAAAGRKGGRISKRGPKDA